MKSSSLIGVGTTATLKRLKQQLLFFDEIAVVLGVNETGDWDCREKDPRLAADLDWLLERGIVKRSTGNAEAINVAVKSANIAEVRFDGSKVLISAPSNATVAVTDKKQLEKHRKVIRVSDLINALCDICCRVECITLEKGSTVRAVSLHPPSTIVSEVAGITMTSSDVVSVVLHSIPMPDETVDLERIIEFRADPDARTRLLALRRWIGTLSARNTTAHDCAQELEYLVHEYEAYMNLHSLKLTRGAVETVITSVAQAAEDLVKIKWGNLAKALFAVNNWKVGLMEAERAAPGREIAYLVKAKHAFRKGSKSHVHTE